MPLIRSIPPWLPFRQIIIRTWGMSTIPIRRMRDSHTLAQNQELPAFTILGRATGQSRT